MPSPNMYPLSSKQNKEILQTSWVQILCNLLWILFFLCFIIFLLNKKSMKSFYLTFLTTFLLNAFAFLFSFPSTSINEYIFDFNLRNSLIIFPLNSFFILPKTFLLTGLKTLSRSSLKSNKFLSLWRSS